MLYEPSNIDRICMGANFFKKYIFGLTTEEATEG
jgi:hypothetical protein